MDTPDLDSWLSRWDIRSGAASEEAEELFHAAPGGVRTTVPFSSTNRWQTLDTDSESGCIRSVEHAYTSDGCLAVLKGNLAPDGAVVKTAGVPEHQFEFTGPAVVSESQEEAVDQSLGGKVREGDFVVVRYEGPKGGPGMQEMLYPTSYLKGLGLGPKCALVTDGRSSGGSSGLSIGHVSPEAASGGAIGLVEDGDQIQVSIPERRLQLLVDESELERRRAARDAAGWRPASREREVSTALRIFGSMALSADKGAARQFD